MRAFLSYSLNDNDQFVIPLVSQRLQEQGFFVSNGGLRHSYEPNHSFFSEIDHSNLFIGVITSTGQFNDRVYREWSYCVRLNIPSILFVEDNYYISPELESSSNIVRFNRSNPKPAIKDIKRKTRPSGKKSTKDAIPYILGGAALIALLTLLTKK